MPNNSDKYSLKTVNIAPQQYQFQSFTPQQADMSLLANSMQRKEERINNADRQAGIVQNALGAIRERINTNDPETAKRFQAKLDDITNQINHYTSIGNYSDAIRMATRFASNISNDEELMGMVKTNKQYQDAISALKSRNDLNDLTKERIIASNPYKLSYITDDNNRIVGTNDFKLNGNIVSDLNIDQINQGILSIANPDSNASQSSTTKGGTTTNPNGTSVGGQHERSSSSSREALTPKKIAAAQDVYLEQHRAAIEQMYDNYVWKRQQLTEQLEDENLDDKQREFLQSQLNQVTNQLTGKNGIYVDYEDMYHGLTDGLRKSATYTRTTSGSSRSDIDNRDDSTAATKLGTNRGFDGYGYLNALNLGSGSVWGLDSKPLGQSYNLISSLSLGNKFNYDVYSKKPITQFGGFKIGFNYGGL